MIIWLASYPKSGNTWLRSLLSSYYYSEDGNFTFDLLKNISQFPQSKFINKSSSRPGDSAKYWISSQKKIIEDKKIKFFKTHNALLNINNYRFTTPEITCGAIYIVRDPRNIITSLKNHYETSYNEAINFMTSDRKYIYDTTENPINLSSFQFLSSWSMHYKSWVYHTPFKTLLVKYEDLLNNQKEIFKKIITFVNKISNLEKSLDDSKLEKSILSTNFEKLQKDELDLGFDEAIISSKNKDKIQFFKYGPDNNWMNLLPKNIQTKANMVFKNDLNKLGYSYEN